MKIIIKISLVLLALSFFISSVSADVCTKLSIEDKDGNKSVIELSKADFKSVFPQDSQKDKALTNAELQTKEARNLFYKPPTGVTGIIGKAAAKLAYYLDDSKTNTKYIGPHLYAVERQNNLQDTASMSISTRYFYDFLTTTKRKLRADPPAVNKDALDSAKQLAIEGVVGALKSSASTATARQLLGFIAVLGDIGASIQDAVNRDAPKAGIKDYDKKKAEYDHKVAIKDKFKIEFTNLESWSKAIYATRSPDKFYTNGVTGSGRTKPSERFTCDGTKDKRQGVLNVGTKVDGELKVAADKVLPGIWWPFQTVPEALVSLCPEEPWAGHFSGSLYECILMLDLLTGTDPTVKADKTNMTDRVNKGAICAGFLVATGMHSAAEEAYVLKDLLGEQLPAINDSCKGATDYVVNNFFKKANRRRLIK